MIESVNLALTAKGQALKAKIEMGAGTIPLSITRITSGSGTSEDPLNLNAVVDEQQEFVITGRTTQGARTGISAVLTNVGLAVGYPLAQIGFYAIDPDEGEILYRISQFAEPNQVPSANDHPWTYQPTFSIVTGNASEVIVNVDLAGMATIQAVWNSVELSDNDTPAVGVKTQYFDVKSVPNYQPAQPDDPTPSPDPVGGMVQLDGGETENGQVQLDGGAVEPLEVEIP
ncbi:MAG: hypothetical protein LBN00_06215 [Oscillospiraceae bacterium]|jgi:hypothetical protein|nr:hypothetical protein [Oscillospiraceae bacterium]